jgi:hypothetical protein
MKINKKKLIKDFIYMGFDYESSIDELSNLISWYKSLPDEMKLYRILQVDSEDDIDLDYPGSHYSTNKKMLLRNHTYTTGYGENKYLIGVLANKSLFDVNETLSNNILYPNENEITLKNKGKGVKILSIKKIVKTINENEGVKISSFILRRYQSNRLKKLLNKSFVYWYYTTKNKEDFVESVFNSIVETYFQLYYGVNIHDRISDVDINEFIGHLKKLHLPFVINWYDKKKSSD